MRCPIPSQNRPGPSCPGGGGGSVKTTASADRGACSGAFHCTRMDIHTEERTRASDLAGTDWTKGTVIHGFCFAGPPPSLGLSPSCIL